MIEVKAPAPWSHNQPTIFLAGTIDMGNSEDWQAKAVHHLRDCNYTILNPRRDDWDSSWSQTLDDHNFTQQVNWELDGLTEADYVLMYLAPGSASPVSLLELGLLVGGGGPELFIVCPPGFYRRGNVQMVAKRAGIPVYDDLERALVALRIIDLATRPLESHG